MVQQQQQNVPATLLQNGSKLLLVNSSNSSAASSSATTPSNGCSSLLPPPSELLLSGLTGQKEFGVDAAHDDGFPTGQKKNGILHHQYQPIFDISGTKFGAWIYIETRTNLMEKIPLPKQANSLPIT